MVNDPSKRFEDGRTAAWQPHEIDFVQNQVRREMPKKRAQQVQRAVDLCKRHIQPAEGKEKLLACILEKLQ